MTRLRTIRSPERRPSSGPAGPAGSARAWPTGSGRRSSKRRAAPRSTRRSPRSTWPAWRWSWPPGARPIHRGLGLARPSPGASLRRGPAPAAAPRGAGRRRRDHARRPGHERPAAPPSPGPHGRASRGAAGRRHLACVLAALLEDRDVLARPARRRAGRSRPAGPGSFSTPRRGHPLGRRARRRPRARRRAADLARRGRPRPPRRLHARRPRRRAAVSSPSPTPTGWPCGRDRRVASSCGLAPGPGCRPPTTWPPRPSSSPPTSTAAAPTLASASPPP